MPAAIVFTDKDIEAAQTMYAFGIPQEQIARILRCTHETLVERLGKQMEDYKVKANARVASTLYQMAISGTQPAATFFWLKTRAGWRETDRLEIESRSVNVNLTAPQDPAQLAQAIRILIESGAIKAEDIMPQLASRNGHASA
jgi:hypothetical protein